MTLMEQIFIVIVQERFRTKLKKIIIDFTKQTQPDFFFFLFFGGFKLFNLVLIKLKHFL